MKHLVASAILLLCYQYLSSQMIYSRFPNDFNEFINSKYINWAADDESVYKFKDSKEIAGKNIYDYILEGINSKTIFPYKNMEEYGDDGNPYEFLNNSIYIQLSDSEKASIDLKLYKDSLKPISFHEIFYLDNYCLKAFVVSGTPTHDVVTESGINLGYSNFFYSDINKNYKSINEAKEDIIFLKEVESLLNFEAPFSPIILKETYSMGLVPALWYGAMKEKARLFDLKTNKEIIAKDIMKYTIFDSIYSNEYDLHGKIVRSYLRPGVPVLHYLKNLVQFKQNIYYNRTKNIFYAIINEAFLSVSYHDFGANKQIEEKRFRIVFK